MRERSHLGVGVAIGIGIESRRRQRRSGSGEPESTPGGPQVISARRRLLKGAVTVPAVLALHSGSAIANASSVRCVANQLNDPMFPSSSTSADTWVRVQLHALKPNANSSAVRWYISGSSIDAVGFGSAMVENNYLQPGTWLQFDPSNQTTVGALLTSQPVWAADTMGVLALGPLWVAIRFDASTMGAHNIGVVDGSSNGSAVAGTCWTSVVNIA